MRKTIISTFAGAVALFAALPAQASTVVVGECDSVSAAAGCLFVGNINGNPDPDNVNGYVNAQNAYNLYNDTVVSAQPDITLTFIAASDAGNFGDFGSITGGGTSSGTWSLPGYTVNYIAVKAGRQFVLYDIVPGASSGDWSTAGALDGKDLSHLAFFGSATVVPEPATWAMMIAGFGLTGAAMRRRKARVAVTYA